MWHNYQNGETIGSKGSEGSIVQDEESDFGARVTLEKDSPTAPWAITCGINDSMVHTIYFSKEKEAIKKFEEIKTELEFLIQKDKQEFYEDLKKFIKKY